MKKTTLLLLLSLFTNSVFATPTCLVTKERMEYNGEIIDLRTETDKMFDASKFFEEAEAHLPLLSKEDFAKINTVNDKKFFIPIELRSKDALVLAGALSLGVVVFQNDREIMDFVQENKTEMTESVASIGNILGREAIIPLAAGSYFIGAVMKNGNLKKVGLFTVGAGLATQLVTEVFKKSFNRVRPNGSDDPYEFFEEGNKSFFSGHVSAAFSLATVVAEVYKDKPLVPYLAYGIAAMTVYARMHDQKHWASDVLAGAVAGHLITKILMRSFNLSERTGSGLEITPTVFPYTGLNIKWTPGVKERQLKCGSLGLTGPDLTRACMEEVFDNSTI